MVPPFVFDATTTAAVFSLHARVTHLQQIVRRLSRPTTKMSACTHPCNGSSDLPPPCTRAQSGQTGCICSTSPCCDDGVPGRRQRTGVRPTGSPAQYVRDVCICGRRVRTPYPHEVLRSERKETLLGGAGLWWRRGIDEIFGEKISESPVIQEIEFCGAFRVHSMVVVVVFPTPFCENITNKFAAFFQFSPENTNSPGTW